jgi:N-hydroxyarylamine O-acetyltransferase
MPEQGSDPFNLDAYLGRIQPTGSVACTLAGLDAIHLAHATNIPFENLDVLLGVPIRLDAASLQHKLIERRRGGYCFEQNTLFRLALQELGFKVTSLAARVRLRATHVTPRTHMLLMVELAGERWIADVGFGEAGLMRPIPLRDDLAHDQFGFLYRLKQEGNDWWVLQSRIEDEWQDLYAFTLEPHFPIDYQVANWYVSTCADSIFVKTLTVQRMTPAARYSIRNRDFMLRTTEQATTQVIESREQLLELLRDVFQLSFPPETQFRSAHYGPAAI